MGTLLGGAVLSSFGALMMVVRLLALVLGLALGMALGMALVAGLLFMRRTPR